MDQAIQLFPNTRRTGSQRATPPRPGMSRAELSQRDVLGHGSVPALARRTATPEPARYSSSLKDSINDTNLEDWNSLRAGEHDVFMDPRFIAAVERSLEPGARSWM